MDQENPRAKAIRDREAAESELPIDSESLRARVHELESENAARQRADEALQSLVTATGTVGEAFFPALVRHLAEALEVRHVFVTRSADESVQRLQTLAIWNTDQIDENISYPVEGTPCGMVATRGEFFCSQGVQQMFPEDHDLERLEAESYLGLRITDASGGTLGHLCVLDSEPIPDPERPLSILRMFSGRVAAELERMRKEEERIVLTRELDHRVKNILSIVNSIAEHTLGSSASLDSFREAFLGRLDSLAIAHDTLARQNWAGAKVDELVQRIIRPHDPSDTERFVCSGPDLILPATVAAPLCLVLHELLTNAIKYGALSVNEGTVAIDWELEHHEHRTDDLRVSWTEGHGPPVSSPSQLGYGTELIRELIPYQLGGEVDLEFSEGGVQCRICIPFPANATTAVAASACELRRPGTEGR